MRGLGYLARNVIPTPITDSRFLSINVKQSRNHNIGDSFRTVKFTFVLRGLFRMSLFSSEPVSDTHAARSTCVGASSVVCVSRHNQNIRDFQDGQIYLCVCRTFSDVFIQFRATERYAYNRPRMCMCKGTSVIYCSSQVIKLFHRPLFN